MKDTWTELLQAQSAGRVVRIRKLYQTAEGLAHGDQIGVTEIRLVDGGHRWPNDVPVFLVEIER